MKITLFTLSGDEHRALDSIKQKYPGAEVINITRSDLGGKSVPQILGEFRNIRPDVFIIYCRDVERQQKLHFLKALSLVTKAKERLLVDEKGHIVKCSLPGFLFTSVPKILLEFILGCLVIAGTYVIVPILHFGEKVGRNKPAKLVRGADAVSLKIAFLRTNPWFDLKAGGSVSHIAGFSKAVTGLKHRLFFISTDKLENIDVTRTPIYIVRPSKVFNTFVEIASIAYNLKLICESLRILRRERPDFLYQRYDSFNWSGIALSKLLRIPVIVEYNGSEVWKGRYWGSMRFLHLARLIEETVLFGGDRIVAISGVLKDNLIKLGVSEERIILNPNGVDPVMFNLGIDGGRIRQKYAIQDKMIVGFLGTFGVWHGTGVLVDAIEPVIKENKGVHFLLIGDGELRGSVEQIIKERRLGEYVTITGLISHGEVPGYLAACDILASPHVPNPDATPFFGSPTKLFEYMAMGKGIVASNLDQIGEVLRHNHSAILVEPGNVAQLAEGILKMAADKELREKLGGQAREAALKNYTWEKNAEKVLKAIRKGARGGRHS